MRHKIILDCDPGHDDAIAILLAGHHPQIELLAITTVAGNQSVDKTTLNALKVCAFAGLTSVPVVRGMDGPLVIEPVYAAHIHGESGLDGANLPEPDIEATGGHAVDFIIETLLASEGDITLVPTGPLTNIAMAIKREPAILPKIRGISLMGGAIGVGNVTASAEFNIYFDPHAAAIVFACGRPITVCPLEVTHQALATESVVSRLRAAQSPVAALAADLCEFLKSKDPYLPASPIHDPCAVAAVIDPTIISGELIRVEIETTGEWTRGRTVCDLHSQLEQTPNAYVGFELDVERFWNMTIETLHSY